MQGGQGACGVREGISGQMRDSLEWRKGFRHAWLAGVIGGDARQAAGWLRPDLDKSWLRGGTRGAGPFGSDVAAVGYTHEGPVWGGRERDGRGLHRG